MSPQYAKFAEVNALALIRVHPKAPDVEKDVLSDVASYGKQMGQVADALLTVIEHLEAHPGNVLADDQAIAAFKELMHSVATVKERHGRKACRPKRR